MFVSKEARKVMSVISAFNDPTDIYMLERILQYTYPERAIPLINKHWPDLEKVRSMVSCGYLGKKYFKEDIDIDWSASIVHYIYLTQEFLKEDFNYKDLNAIGKLASYDFDRINKVIKGIKVNSLWYLLKVVETTEAKDTEDSLKYKPYISEEQGNTSRNMIAVEGLKAYVE